MIELMKTLCELDGLPGDEGRIRDFIRERVEKYAEEIFTDSVGNLFVFKRGKDRPETRVMYSAHMDEVGAMVTGYTDDGFVKFAFAGGVDRRVVIGKRVRIGDKRIPGVIGIKPIHLTRKAEREGVPKRSDLYIDIGAKNADEAKNTVEKGELIAFDSDAYLMGNDMFKAKAIDDRIGVAVLIKMIESELAYDAWFVFTAQEEIGLRGGRVCAFSIEPEVAVNIDTTRADDLPGVSDNRRGCTPGNGPLIMAYDSTTKYKRRMVDAAIEAAESENIPWKFKLAGAGGTDAGGIHQQRGGILTIGLACPVRYSHTPSCVASVKDFYHMEKLAKAILKTIGGRKNV